MNATYGFHATMTARPGKADELIELLLSRAPTTNKSCVLFLVGHSASDPSVVHVTEGWTTKEAHAQNFAQEQSQALVANIALLVTDGAQYQDEVPVGGAFRAEAEVRP
jgi:quinol monooxygenase YgiN